MTKKNRIFKNGLLWGVILMLAGIVLAGNGETTGGVLALVGFFIFVLSLIRSLLRKLKKKPAMPMQSVHPEMYVAIKDGKAAPRAQHEKPVATASEGNASIQTERHKIAGMQYRRDGIEDLASPNPDYDMTNAEIMDTYEPGDRIYKYTFDVTPKLVPEPNNEFDPNAIRVEADGVHIGYIKAGSCAHIRKLMNAGKITKMEIDIYGGPLKIVDEDYNDDGDTKVKIIKEEHEYAATLTLYVKQD